MTNEERIKELKEKIELLTVVAIPREEDAFAFYVNLANKSSREELKHTFITLAKEERGHREKLQKMLDDAKRELDELQGKG